MEEHFSIGQNPQRAVVPVEEEDASSPHIQSVHRFIRDGDCNQKFVFVKIQKYFQIPRVPQHLRVIFIAVV